MENLYDQQFSDETAIYHYAKQRYSTLMSYAQGYLFYYAQQKKIGKS